MSATLNFRRRPVPLIMQTEAAECGLACLAAMIAGHHGIETDLQTMRREHAVSLKGSTLKSLIDIADSMNLAARPLRVELPALRQLRLPAILHVDFNHFVVLTAVHADRVELHDPARGARTQSITEFSKHFTGIALELTPTPAFAKASQRRAVLHLVHRRRCPRVPAAPCCGWWHWRSPSKCSHWRCRGSPTHG